MPDNSKPAEVTKPAMSITECRETATRIDAFLPDAMRAMPWCTWRYEETKYGQMNAKIPRHPMETYWRGRNAPRRRCKTDNIRTFGSYEEARAALQDGGQYNGIGVYLGEAGGGLNLTVADVDWKAYTGVLNAGGIPPRVQDLIDELNGLTEMSVSGQGVHVFLEGSLDAEEEAGRFKKISLGEGIDLEVYQEARYVGVTGKIVNNPGWHDCQDQVQMLERMMRMPVIERPAGEYAPDTVGMLIGSSHAAIQNGCDSDTVFRSLWLTGLMPEPGVGLRPEQLADPAILERYMTVAGDGNRRELRLLTKLAWYGLNAAEIDAAYRTSPAFENRAWKWDSGRGSDTYGSLSIEAALRRQTDRYSGKLKAAPTAVDTEAVQAAYASRRALLIDSIGTIRGSAAGRLGLRELVDEILTLIGAGQFEVQGSELRISTGGLDGLAVLLGSDRTMIRDRLQFAASQGLLGAVIPGAARGEATTVLMPINPDDLVAISEGLHPGVTIPKSAAATRSAARRAAQIAAGTLPERKPRPKSAPRPPTLHRARYVAEHVFAAHSYSNPELAAATQESIGMIRRCSGMMLSHGYVRTLPRRRFQAVQGAQEQFASDLAAEHDRIRHRGAVVNETHRANYYRGRLSETGKARWAQLLARSEERLARLEAGESIRKVLAA